MRLAKGNFYVSAHGLIRKCNRYLITKRSLKEYFKPGFWDLPGGTINFGENLEKALQREVWEEVKLKVKPIKIISAYTKWSNQHNTQVTQLVYLCDYISGEVKLNKHEHSDYHWVYKKDLKKFKLIHFVKDLVDKI